MNKWNEKINDFFGNDELMANIRSGVVLLLAIGLGLLYFGLYNSFDIKALISVKTIGLTVIAMMSNWLWRIDIEIRAFNDELRDNEILAQVENDIETESNNFDDYDSALEYVKEWNDKQQDLYNKLKTEERIRVLTQQSRYNKIRPKRFWHKIKKPRSNYNIAQEIERLEVNPLIDKSFKPITVNQLISVQKIKKNNERKGQDSIEYNPKREGTAKSLLFSLFKFVGIGGGGGLAFGITDNPKSILIYYVLLLIALALTTFKRYPKVRKNTKTTYLQTRKNKLKLIQDMKQFTPIKRLPLPKEKALD